MSAWCMTPQRGTACEHGNCKKSIERRRIRYAQMIGVTPQLMQQGMRAPTAWWIRP